MSQTIELATNPHSKDERAWTHQPRDVLKFDDSQRRQRAYFLMEIIGGYATSVGQDSESAVVYGADVDKDHTTPGITVYDRSGGVSLSYQCINEQVAVIRFIPGSEGQKPEVYYIEN